MMALDDFHIIVIPTCRKQQRMADSPAGVA
jgi:hypothetical protein